MKPALARVSAATRGRMLVLSRNEMVSAVLLEVGPGDCRHANASTFGPYIVLVIRDASMALKSTSPSAGLAHPALGRRVGGAVRHFHPRWRMGFRRLWAPQPNLPI